MTTLPPFLPYSFLLSNLYSLFSSPIRSSFVPRNDYSSPFAGSGSPRLRLIFSSRCAPLLRFTPRRTRRSGVRATCPALFAGFVENSWTALPRGLLSALSSLFSTLFPPYSSPPFLPPHLFSRNKSKSIPSRPLVHKMSLYPITHLVTSRDPSSLIIPPGSSYYSDILYSFSLPGIVPFLIQRFNSPFHLYYSLPSLSSLFSCNGSKISL